VIRIELGERDLVGLRLAHSPMAEVVASVSLARRPSAPAWWRAGAVATLRTLPALGALLAAPAGYVPDFLTPAPVVSRPRLDDELRVVAATPLDRVVAEVDRAWVGHAPPRFATDPAAGLAQVVTEIRRYWAAVVAPLWPRVRSVVEAELVFRARVAVTDGPRSLLAGLHPTVAWDGATLDVHCATDERWGLDGHPLTLVPAALAGPKVHTMGDAPDGRALWYPPRGHGRLWETTVAPATALANLLGPTRAAVLTLLAAPATTGAVADALGLAPATASHHLTTLRDAGLLLGERVGRQVRYSRTPLGDDLAGTAAP